MGSELSTKTQPTSSDTPPWEPVVLDLTIATPIPEPSDEEFPFDDDIPW